MNNDIRADLIEIYFLVTGSSLAFNDNRHALIYRVESVTFVMEFEKKEKACLEKL